MAETESHIYKLPRHFLQSIEKQLDTYGVNLHEVDSYWRCIQKLSDFYIQNPTGQTPWQEDYVQIAYLSYYLPLNFLRCLAVVDRLIQVGFWDGLKRQMEFGSGNGALHLALKERGILFEESHFVELSTQAIQQHRQMLGEDLSRNFWHKSLLKISHEQSSQTLASMCYSLTELEEFPSWTNGAQAILVIEPSTHQDARRLMQFRQRWMENSYFVWGPCTHQGPCPLLTQSEKDWCHDRVNFELPAYMEALNRKLPFSIGSLGFSYLALRRDPPSGKLGELSRVVGDPLVERGKTRQMLCRSSEREFLSWMSKREPVPNLDRGALVKLASDTTKKSNELRDLHGLKLAPPRISKD